MRIFRILAALSLASILVVGPSRLVQANNAHHPGRTAAMKQGGEVKKKANVPRKNIRGQKQSGVPGPVAWDPGSVVRT